MEHHSIPVNATLQGLVARAADVWTLDACGVTRSQTPLPALVHREAYAPTTSRPRVLLVGGFVGMRVVPRGTQMCEVARGRVDRGHPLAARHLRFELDPGELDRELAAALTGSPARLFPNAD
jgi:hypothetical protein